MSKPSFWSQIRSTIRTADQWLKQTPERSLEQAYEAALKIRKLEEDHFQGQSILSNAPGYEPNSLSMFRNDLKRHLTTTKVRLAEFRLSYGIVSLVSPESMRGYTLNDHSDTPEYIEQSEILLEKLRFIDQVVLRYAPRSQVITQPRSDDSKAVILSEADPSQPLQTPRSIVRQAIEDAETITDKTGILPRSILGTITKIQKNLDPEAVGEVVEDFRSRRSLNLIALRFLVLVIVITLSSRMVAKTFVIGPIVDQLRSGEQVEVFINSIHEEEALQKLQSYEERLKFQVLLGKLPPLSSDQLEAKLKEKAAEISQEYRQQGSNAIKNIFADLFSVIIFIAFLLVSRQEIEALKLFMDRIIYGLSDSAKAFILILLTDVFVGFHSPHGWEILMEGLADHFGLPPNREFIFLFIATFPVLLDTVFKYWIFRYLNRVAPSAVSVLKTMNET